MTAPTRISDADQTASVPLEVVDIRIELEQRPHRDPDPAKEFLAFSALAAEMANNPRNMLQRLVEVAVELCDAHTAGISLLEGEVFRWEAVAGIFASAKGGTMPRAQSPCGVCIDRQATQLMHLPDRAFPALAAEPRFVEALLIPFYDNGRAIGTVWIVSHTAERKFNQDDERIVSALSQFASAGWQLLRSAEALAQINSRKDDFLATLGHELRNPLSAIVNGAAVLEVVANRDPVAKDAVAIISRQAEHIARLADDLLDIAAIANAKVQLALQRIDLRAIMAQTLNASRGRIERGNHLLTEDLGSDPVFIHADAVRIAQIIGNLLDNASKYTPGAGVISVALSTDFTHASIDVRDTGIGIPVTALQDIFEPFTQLSDAKGGSTRGLGLGLALVKQLTELHDGAVTASSGGSEAGSCFTVRLPLWSPPATIQ